MAQAVVLQPLAEGGVAGVLSAALGKALRQQDEGMQLGHGVVACGTPCAIASSADAMRERQAPSKHSTGESCRRIRSPSPGRIVGSSFALLIADNLSRD